MKLDEAIRLRIKEVIKEKNISLTALCLNSNLTPSTIFDFMYGRSKNPSILTIKKLCIGAGISLHEFFNKDYFNSDEDVY
ncbi:MAG: helix-turn-helix transcriptional regulator [Clostridia bacterium]|nr:helix-turn-helix transcriptional regulator [Clostridia bacterium]